MITEYGAAHSAFGVVDELAQVDRSPRLFEVGRRDSVRVDFFTRADACATG